MSKMVYDVLEILAIVASTLFRLSHTLPTNTAVTSAPPPAHSNLNCYSVNRIQQYRDKCVTDQGLHITIMGQGDNKRSPEMMNTIKHSYIDAIIAQDLSQLCLQPTRFQTALECIKNHTVSCMPQVYHDYMPQPHTMQALVDTLCENTTKINFRCVEQKSHRLYKCRQERLIESFGITKNVSTFDKFACIASRANTECLKTELRLCGCATVQLYESLARDHLHPPACPRDASEAPPTICDANNEDLFVENSADLFLASYFLRIAVFMFYIIKVSGAGV